MRTACGTLAALALLVFLSVPSATSAAPAATRPAEAAALAASGGEPSPGTPSDQELQEELRKLRESAKKEAEAEATESTQPQETTFTSGALGLQALNPEVSVTGDFLSSYRAGSDVHARFGNMFRSLGLHFEAYLDPFSKFKAAVPVSTEGAELGEAYFTRFGILGSMSLTLGKFRQQFGVVNRWHKHALDQVDFPLALRQIFGPGGLNQIGASVQWQMPAVGGMAQELTFQLTNGQNPRVFGQNTENFPSFLLHYKNYRDLSKDTYLELGLTGLAGRNDTWQVTVTDTGTVRTTVAKTDRLPTYVLGADLTLLWEPTDRMRYRNWQWRTEVYLAQKQILAPDGTGESTIRSWGAYSYYETKVSRTFLLGARVDYYQPDRQPYAGGVGDPLWPLATNVSDTPQWGALGYVTWYQSPWVHWRLEYDHQWNGDFGPDDDTVWLQCVFAAGPHKHDRY